MESVYVITEINYGEVCWECDTLADMEVFKDKDKALERFNYLIKGHIDTQGAGTCGTWVLDEEADIENIKVGDTIRFFYGVQDNWDSYFEVQLHEVKIQD